MRLVVEGLPSPRGRTMLEKREWVMRHADGWRRALLLEPRGHADLCGALLTEPVHPGSHAGVLFMNSDGYAAMSGHSLIAVATIALERGLIMPGGDGAHVSFDTPAGTVRARATIAAAPERPEDGGGSKSAGGEDAAERIRVTRISFVSVPSFVVHAGLPVVLGQRTVRADVAFGGAFYAVVDSEAVGLPVDPAHLPELRRAGVEVARALASSQQIVHPLEPALRGMEGTIFTAPAADERSTVRTLTISIGARADCSPGGTATAAVMAIIDAMGLVAADTEFTHESLIGTRFTGRIVDRTMVGDRPAIVPEIEGDAWITGEHTFIMDRADPLVEGFRL